MEKELAVERQTEELRQLAYKRGFLDGIQAYAWMKDGVYYVGSGNRTLKQAVAEVESTYNYRPTGDSMLRGEE